MKDPKLSELVVLEIFAWVEPPVDGCGTNSYSDKLILERKCAHIAIADMLEAYLDRPSEKLYPDAYAPRAGMLASIFVRPLVQENSFPSTWRAYGGGAGIGQSIFTLSDKTPVEGVQARIKELREDGSF
jgi:hypothetical protein